MMNISNFFSKLIAVFAIISPFLLRILKKQV